MKRGIVSLPTQIIPTENGDGFSTGIGLTKIDLNFFSLYWDSIVIPTNNFIHIRLIDEERYIDAGVLRRPMLQFTGSMHSGQMPSFIFDNQLRLLDSLRQQKDYDWRMNVLGEEFRMPDAESFIKESLRIELQNALPVPGSDVDVQDILEFKESRKNLLIDLNEYVDEVYLEVVNSGDFNLARAKAFSKLNAVLNELESLVARRWQSPIKFDLSAMTEFDLGDIKDWVAGLGSIWEACNHNYASAIAAGIYAAAGTGVAKIKPVIQSVRRDVPKHLAYLSKAHDEGIIENIRR